MITAGAWLMLDNMTNRLIWNVIFISRESYKTIPEILVTSLHPSNGTKFQVIERLDIFNILKFTSL